MTKKNNYLVYCRKSRQNKLIPMVIHNIQKIKVFLHSWYKITTVPCNVLDEVIVLSTIKIQNHGDDILLLWSKAMCYIISNTEEHKWQNISVFMLYIGVCLSVDHCRNSVLYLHKLFCCIIAFIYLTLKNVRKCWKCHLLSMYKWYEKIILFSEWLFFS